MKEHIDLINLSFDNITFLAPYGSRVYGTNDEFSDYDYIAIAKDEWLKKALNCETHLPNIDVNVYSPERFLVLLKEHDISVLESLWVEPLVNKSEILSSPIDKMILRKSISAKSSNSWVKAKKKLTVESNSQRDASYRIGIKSLFHSFRILDFGIQIATHNKIVDYRSSMNYWIVMRNYLHAPYVTWDEIYSIWKKEHNKLQSEFRKLAPKE
jgi:predicted nucleotidyltransferase